MAGTAASPKTTNILLGAGNVYANVAIPAGGGRLTLYTDNTPDATANPSAVHLGSTKSGAKITISTKQTDYYVDEYPAPIATNVEQIDASIAGEFVGVTDMTLLALMTPGAGTRGTGSGYDQLTIGHIALVYPSICIIAPLIEDTTKVIVCQLYKSLNSSGISIDIGRKTLAFTPFNFKAYEVTSRAAADTLCSIWKQA